jgi:2-methylisocitrate lyase-like PEP mutase family enzyme
MVAAVDGKVLERAGAAGLQIEDQVFPKRCGHFDGKEVVPLEEMLARIKATVDTRRDGDLQIVARTDARAVLGLQAAIDRAGAMIEASGSEGIMNPSVLLLQCLGKNW